MAFGSLLGGLNLSVPFALIEITGQKMDYHC